jgi:hypothetical protein
VSYLSAACLSFFHRIRAKKQSCIKTGQEIRLRHCVKSTLKRKPITPQHHPLKIAVQPVALLPNSGLGVSNYLFSLKMHPCPNTALFFALRTQVGGLCYFTPMARFLARSSAGQSQKVKRPLRSGPPGLFPVEPRGLRQGHNPRQVTAGSPHGKAYNPPAPAFPLNPTTIPAWFLPQKPPYP